MAYWDNETDTWRTGDDPREAAQPAPTQAAPSAPSNPSGVKVVKLDHDPDDNNWGGWTEGTIKNVATAMDLPTTPQGMGQAMTALRQMPVGGQGDVLAYNPATGKGITAYNAGPVGSWGSGEGEFTGDDGNRYFPADRTLAAAIKNHPTDSFSSFLDNGGGFALIALPFAIAAAAGALGGAGGAAGAGLEGALAGGIGDGLGIGGSFLPVSAAGEVAAGLSAADIAGLTQMGLDAGLAGGALESFVASGGALGSTAAGGGGVVGLATNPTIGSAGYTPPSGTGGVLENLQNVPTGNPLDTGDAELGQAMQNSAATGGGPGVTSPITGAGAAGASGLSQTALQWLSEQTGIPTGLLSAGGSILQGALGILSGMQQSGATTDIANQLRADRAPALNAFNTALANPDTFYNSAPAMGATEGVLRKLSATGGNPWGNPGDLSKAAAYNLGGYNDYLRGLSGPAFGTANAETNVNLAGVQQQGGAWEAGGSALQNLLNPRQTYRLNLGGSLI